MQYNSVDYTLLFIGATTKAYKTDIDVKLFTSLWGVEK